MRKGNFERDFGLKIKEEFPQTFVIQELSKFNFRGSELQFSCTIFELFKNT